MLNRLMIVTLVLINTFTLCFAGDVTTLEEAKKLSSQTGKPILLEFYQDDCEYCSKAAQDAINVPAVKQALDNVIHLTVLEKGDYGQELSNYYFTGIYYPVFYVLNTEGEIMKRWTGYTTPEPFIRNLNESLTEKITLEQRVRRFESDPTYDDAVNLAEYYTEVWDYLGANEYYRKARQLGNQGESAFVFEIFKNAANAAWQDTITFEEALPYADTAVKHFAGNPQRLLQVAQIMARLGRKLEKGALIEPYITAAINATERRGVHYQKDNTLLKSEYALAVENDTAKATELKQSTLPQGWESNPGEFYSYAKWCLEHRINLEEAETYTRQAVDLASPGAFRGKVLSTLAYIYDALGKTTEAAQSMSQALENDPGNKTYAEKLAEFQGKM